MTLYGKLGRLIESFGRYRVDNVIEFFGRPPHRPGRCLELTVSRPWALKCAKQVSEFSVSLAWVHAMVEEHDLGPQFTDPGGQRAVVGEVGSGRRDLVQAHPVYSVPVQIEAELSHDLARGPPAVVGVHVPDHRHSGAVQAFCHLLKRRLGRGPWPV